MQKILYFDVETTGLDPVKNDIIQLAGIIEIDGHIMKEFDIKMQPFSYENIEQEALDTHGYTLDQIREFPKPEEAYRSLLNVLAEHCDKFNRADKYYPAGYNVSFDLDFLSQFFKKNNDKYLGSWINWRKLDPLPFLYLHDFLTEMDLPNYKLETVCDHFNIQLKAHDALSDVQATRELLHKVFKQCKGV